MAVYRRVYPDDTLGRHGWFVMGHPFDPPPVGAPCYPHPFGSPEFLDPTLDKPQRQV